MSRRGWVLFVSLGVIWGIPYLMIKVAVQELTPGSVVFLRTALAGAVLLPVAGWRGQLRPLLPRWRALLAFTAVELAVPWFLLGTAERTLSSSLAGLLTAAVPMVGALLGWLTGGERLGPRRLVGLLVGLLGVVALLGTDLAGGSPLVLLEMAVVVVGYAAGPFILTRWLADQPGLAVIAAALGIAAVAWLPVAAVQLPHHWPPGRVIGAVLVLAGVCTATSFLVFFALIAEVGPVRATVITYLNPAVAVGLGVAILHEPLTIGILLGFVLVLAGSVLATQRSVAAIAPAAPPPAAAPACSGSPVNHLP